MVVDYDYDLFTAVEMVMVIVISHSKKTIMQINSSLTNYFLFL